MRACSCAASYHGQVDFTADARVAQLLLEHGVIVDAQGCNHHTQASSRHASAYGHRDLAVVEILLAHEPDVHIRGADGTPLQVATSEGHLELRNCC
jgi:ankyrin repeat protein